MPIFAFQNRLIDFAIEHSRTTFLILLAIIAFGLLARLSIPIESEPVVEIPKFNISVKHEGISSNDATSLLIAPLEQEDRLLRTICAAKFQESERRRMYRSSSCPAIVL